MRIPRENTIKIKGHANPRALSLNKTILKCSNEGNEEQWRTLINQV